MATPGTRNHTLNACALRAYRVADGCSMDRQPFTDRMTEAGGRCGLGDSEIAATLLSAQNGATKYGPVHRDPRPDPTPLGNTTFDPNDSDSENGAEPTKFAAILLNRNALRMLPKPEPLIGGTIDQGTVALLYGKWASYKTFIALDWAASVATGHSWQGRTTEKRRVLYVAAEGAFGLSARIEAWEIGWQKQIADDDFQVLPRAVNLTNTAEVRELAALIRWGGFGFVIFDTLARCMVGADENSAKDCGEVVDALTRLRECTPDGRGVVLGVHHTGKDGRTFRGSSVFEAGADTVYAVSADNGAITLEREKRKDGPQDDRHQLQFDAIEGSESGVVNVRRGVDMNGRASDLLSTFVRHFAVTGATKGELRLAADMPPATFHRSLNELLRSGLLVNQGTEKRAFYKEPS